MQRRTMSACSLIFPFQLFDPHPAIAGDRKVFFVEESLLFGDPLVGLQFHKQRSVLLRAAMKTYAAELTRRGYEVEYRPATEGAMIGEHCAELVRAGFDELHVCEVTDFLLEKRLRRFSDQSGVKLHWHESPMFLSPKELLAEHFDGERRPFMARFYETQRRRMGILMDAGDKPVGGRWSFDDENRKPMPKRGLSVPIAPTAKPSEVTRQTLADAEVDFAAGHGELDGFSYPVSHDAASDWFEDFLETRFQQFGPYEDAISARERALFHGILTPMMNIGLLTPEHVVTRALKFAKERDIPLNSLEGFVRQIIGWREFIRGAYEAVGVRSRNGNFWEFEDRPIPEEFYTGATGIVPVDTAIKRALTTGYCHHVERLMVLGNFMLLCGFHPNRVYNWFMEMFVDAYDWVMVPNVYGMSQFADGGQFTTKPYISGSNYIRKMSDYANGDWCHAWDGLFWAFIEKHQDFFRSQHRLGMMPRQLDRMPSEKRSEHLDNAQAFLDRLSWQR